MRRVFRTMFPNDFLKASRKLLLEQKTTTLPQSTVNIVMGNEASDADSIISSIAYAWYLTHRCDQKQLYVPVMNIPKEDLALRGEVCSIISIYIIKLSSVLFFLTSIFHQINEYFNIIP